MKVFLLRLIFLVAIALGGIGVCVFGYERTENVLNAIIHMSEAGYTGGAIASGLIVCMGLYCLLQLELFILSKEQHKND
jgi:hypothetical protein